MNPVNRNLNNRIRRTLYSLKRLYGGPLSLYKLNDISTDLATGEKTVTKTVYPVRRAIILPEQIGRDAPKSISQISANKKFVTGGVYEKGVRAFIIDRRDIDADLELTLDDWIVFNSRRFNFKTVQEFEFGAAWFITGQEVMGIRPEQVFLLSADNLVVPSSQAGAE